MRKDHGIGPRPTSPPPKDQSSTRNDQMRKDWSPTMGPQTIRIVTVRRKMEHGPTLSITITRTKEYLPWSPGGGDNP